MTRVPAAPAIFLVYALATTPAFAQEWKSRSDLAGTHAIGEGHAPIEVVTDGLRVTAQREAGSNDDGTLLTISNDQDQQVKFDVYISPDGERFLYTSSCTLIAGGKNFEHWPHPVRAFAIGRIRLASEHACD